MENEGLITIDVGGTSIKACLVGNNAMILDETVAVYESKANHEAEVILDQFVMVISDQVSKAATLDMSVIGIGLAFPGPFDYDEGICLLDGLDKYDALYNFNIRKYISMQVEGSPHLRAQFASNYKVFFINDAEAFAIGETAYGAARSIERAICLTLGTGIGSTFVEHGRIVNDKVPLDGELYRLPFKEGIADDYISKRGIQGIAKSLGFDNVHLDVIDFAHLAVKGDQRSVEVFRVFGDNLGQVIEPFVKFFNPNAIILGGQISKSSSLFIPAFQKCISHFHTEVSVTKDTLFSIWKGLYVHYNNHLSA